MHDSNPIFSPIPRSFYHFNYSNPDISWGDKFEGQCIEGLCPDPTNFLIGDSHIERLFRPRLLNFTQDRLPGWNNCGIGGDKIQHVLWRLRHGGMPVNPNKMIFSAGSNNLIKNNLNNCAQIANTIMASVNFLLTNYPDINVAILGIFPRENSCKSQAATIINHMLQWKLPSLVTFIAPPKEFSTASGKPNIQFYERDMIHLNSKGYNVLLNALNSFITTDTDSLGLDAIPT